MIGLNQAQEIANETIAGAPYSDYDLTLATGDLPLKLPFGYRFPYDSYVGISRVSQTMLILFVDEQGEVEVEWDDFERQDVADRMKRFKESSEKGQPTLPPLPKALDGVQKEHKNAQIETVEAVWAETPESEALLHWQVGIVEGIDRSVVLVSGAPDALEVGEARQRPRYFASIEWKLCRAEYKAKRLRVNLTKLEKQEHLRSYWTVWSCMSCLIEFAEELKYGEFDLHNVRVERVPSNEAFGAKFDPLGPIPRVRFFNKGGWDTDVSIILHELGHALWWLLYTRPPRCIDLDVHGTTQQAIKEAFADYVAATILANGEQTVRIGGDLDKKVAERNHLPRPIDGLPFAPPPSEDDPHEIGRKWVNLLWDFRSQVGKDDANRVVIAAHVKPRPGDQAPDEPMACYFQSLKNTAAHMNVSFDDWDKLAHKHGVAH